MEPFLSLTSLELRGCDLSTANWDGLPLLQASLRELRVHDTLESLHHLLAPHAVAVTPAGEAAKHRQLATGSSSDRRTCGGVRVHERPETLQRLQLGRSP